MECPVCSLVGWVGLKGRGTQNSHNMMKGHYVLSSGNHAAGKIQVACQVWLGGSEIHRADPKTVKTHDVYRAVRADLEIATTW